MICGIKCKYIINDILSPLINKQRLLNIIKYNKKLQSLFNISINDYKTISQIIIELTFPKTRIYTSEELFINYEQRYKQYFHVYFNDSEDEQDYPKNINYDLIDSFKHFIRSKITNKEKELVKGYFLKKHKIKKIKIVIDYPVTSLKCLFKDCTGIRHINFIQFYRKNITDMSQMFYNCNNLEKLTMKNFVTINVTNMSDMFQVCRRIKTIDFSSFDTKNVTDMSFMFSECENLRQLDLTKFRTNNLTKMSNMFSECLELT